MPDNNFEQFNFETNLMDGLISMGFKDPTPIQEMAIPVVNENHDLIACAQTGTGKTAAFLLPIMNQIIKANNENQDDQIHTMIIAPTRELALQIDQQIDALGYFTGVSSAPVYGGTDAHEFERQKQALTTGANIIIATPGKLLAHLRFGYVKCKNLKALILDEADRMMDMGFHDDIMQIISYLPKERQTLLFSATMPPKIRQLSKKLLKDPKEINISISKPAEGVMQAAYRVYDEQKAKLIQHLLDGKKSYNSVLVFASRKSSCKTVAKTLAKAGLSSKEIHSDLNQAEREEVLRDFKNRTVQILVGTDIVARGIDVDDISLVINYDVPNDAEDYVHRVGRTARAASTGVALTFINPDEDYKFKKIEQIIEMDIPKLKLPEGFDEVVIKQRGKGKYKGKGGGKPYHKKGKKPFYKKKSK